MIVQGVYLSTMNTEQKGQQLGSSKEMIPCALTKSRQEIFRYAHVDGLQSTFFLFLIFIFRECVGSGGVGMGQRRERGKQTPC